MPPVPVRNAATVLVVRPARSGGEGPLEVLMVERPSAASFGGLMVFPGGALEECDLREGSGLDDAAFRMAGIRETAEEVGFVITDDGFRPSPRLRGPELIDSWKGHGINPGLDRMTLVSRWLTPHGQPARFDTRFYLADLEGDPVIELDSDELEGHVWVTPERALEQARSGRWQLILPTFAHLRWLGRRNSIAHAHSSAAGADGMTVIEPEMRNGTPVIRYRSADED